MFDVGSWLTFKTTVWDAAQKATKPTSFKVDPDELPRLRKGMREALKELRAIHKDAQFLRNLKAPAADGVSQDAAQRLGKLAGDDDGCLGKAVTDAIDRVQGIIDQINDTERTYRNVEDDEARAYRGHS